MDSLILLIGGIALIFVGFYFLYTKNHENYNKRKSDGIFCIIAGITYSLISFVPTQFLVYLAVGSFFIIFGIVQLFLLKKKPELAYNMRSIIIFFVSGIWFIIYPFIP